jgi:hypothetical protein
MKIYKFKDFNDEQKLSHFYQIVLENTIWCARPDSLNDKDEFKFKIDYKPSSHLSTSLVLKHKKLEEIAEPIINDMINSCRNTIGVVSFSITKTDDHLWNEYGGNGNGVCIEIIVPEAVLNKTFFPVHYVPEKIFHVDSFLESALFQDQVFNTYRNMLLTKTRKWEQEEEIRFIANRQEVNMKIDGYVNEIRLSK